MAGFAIYNIPFEEHPTDQQHVICNECIIQNMQVLAYESVAERDELIAILQAIEPKNTK
jgi:hypothetical protein